MVNDGTTRRRGLADVGNGDESWFARSGKLKSALTLTDFFGVTGSGSGWVSSGKSSIKMTMTVMSSVRVSY